MSEIKPTPEKVVAKYNSAVEHYDKIFRQDRSGRMIDDAKFLIRQAIKGDSRPEQVARAKAWIGQRNWQAEGYAEDNLPRLKEQAAAEARADGKEVNPL